MTTLPDDRPPPAHRSTRDNVAAGGSGTTPRGKVFDLGDCALIAPILRDGVQARQRDGLRLSRAQQAIVARITVAESRARELSMLLTVREAAQLLQIGERRVRKLIDGGQLDARMVDGKWLVERASVLVRLSAARRTRVHDTSPPAGERAPREPATLVRRDRSDPLHTRQMAVPQRPHGHLRQFSDPTGNAAVARATSEGPLDHG